MNILNCSQFICRQVHRKYTPLQNVQGTKTSYVQISENIQQHIVLSNISILTITCKNQATDHKNAKQKSIYILLVYFFYTNSPKLIQKPYIKNYYQNYLKKISKELRHQKYQTHGWSEQWPDFGCEGIFCLNWLIVKLICTNLAKNWIKYLNVQNQGTLFARKFGFDEASETCKKALDQLHAGIEISYLNETFTKEKIYENAKKYYFAAIQGKTCEEILKDYQPC
eukprot:TRINITY_DN6203_c0_g1_i7.p1 TRINITY_DN6203_c0_g1~~TRINITY_DN6203_c0_g1_i7.p1  ORF type:complete len:225 (-),score=11.85 TRINITY_DN6203_c0_g1_i7:843-1517(-)